MLSVFLLALIVAIYCLAPARDGGRSGGERMMPEASPQLLYWSHDIAVSMFGLGLVGFLIRRNAIVVLMCLELMLNAANLLLVEARWDGNSDGILMVIFVITVAAAEVAVGLGIVLNLYRLKGTVELDAFRNLQGWRMANLILIMILLPLAGSILNGLVLRTPFPRRAGVIATLASTGKLRRGGFSMAQPRRDEPAPYAQLSLDGDRRAPRLTGVSSSTGSRR